MPNRPKRKKDMSEENNAEQSEVQAPDINIGDFNAILQIIDVASARGAFRGEELTSVGTVRDRVSAFVSFYTPKEEAKGDDDTSQATTESTEATEETSE